MYSRFLLCIPHACLCPWRPEDSIRAPGAGVIDSCELPVGAGNQSDPWQEQPSQCLTAEPSPAPSFKYFC